MKEQIKKFIKDNCIVRNSEVYMNNCYLTLIASVADDIVTYDDRTIGGFCDIATMTI